MVSRELAGVPFDYGAQYFTARDPSFQRLADELTREGELAIWKPRAVQIIDTEWQPLSAKLLASPWYVAPRGFSALLSHLSVGVDVRQSTHVTRCTRTTRRTPWEITCGDGSVMEADELLLTVPGPQLETILGHPIVNAPAHVPCWSLSVAFETKLSAPFDAAQIEDSDLAWISRETSKPGRQAASIDVWTLHASTTFSESMQKEDAAAVEPRMLRAFFALPALKTNEAMLPIASHLHRWRFARALSNTALNTPPYQYSEGLGIAGDGMGGARVESAYLSGLALANAVLRSRATAGRESPSSP